MRINLFLLGFIALLGFVADWLFPSVGVYIHAEAIAAAAAITAVAAIIGGIFSSASNNSAAKRTAAANLQATRETNEANYKMFQEANQFNLDLWNKENEYNTPAAQVQRLQEAGLNPYLMMSNGTTGSASSLTSADYKNAETPDLSALQNIQSPLGVVGQGVQSALQGLATGIQMKDAYNKAKISGSDAAYRDAMNAANVKYTLDNARLTSNQARGALADAIVSERTVGSRVQASKETSNLLYNQSRLASANADDAENRFVNNMRQNYYAWSTLSDIERMKEVVNGLDLDNKLKRKTLDWYDTLQQKGIDMINSNIQRNQSEITRNNHLNNLTDAQKNLCIEEKKAKELENIINGDPNVQDAKKMQEYIKSTPTNVQQAIFADPWYQRYIKTIRDGKKPSYEVSWNVKRLYAQYGLISGDMNVAAGATLGNTFGTSVGSSRQNSDTPK